MNSNLWKTCVLLLPFLVTLLVATVAVAGQQESKQTTAAEVRAKTAKAYDSLKNYTVRQRDKAVADAREELKKLDHRIDEIQRDIDEHWEKMSAASRKQTRKTLDLLRQKREKAAEWYGGLKHSSAEAWEEVKKGFADSYDRLQEAVKEFEKKD